MIPIIGSKSHFLFYYCVINPKTGAYNAFREHSYIGVITIQVDTLILREMHYQQIVSRTIQKTSTVFSYLVYIFIVCGIVKTNMGAISSQFQ